MCNDISVISKVYKTIGYICTVHIFILACNYIFQLYNLNNTYYHLFVYYTDDMCLAQNNRLL